MDRRNSVKNLILLALLAAICVCAAELAACRVMDPELYEILVTPARNLYHDTRAQVKGISAEYADWLREQGETRQQIAQAQRIRAEERRAERLLRAEERRAERLLRKEAREEEARERLLRRAEQKRLRTDRGAAQRLLREAQLATAPALIEILFKDPAVTELVFRDNREYLTGGPRPLYYYNQKDELWAGALFGRDPIGGYGCGPVALAMLISTLCERPVTPVDVAEWGAKAGFAAPGSGSYLSIVQGAAKASGLACASLPVGDAEALRQAIRDGGIAVALMGPGHFTAHGHFILLHGVAPTGEILVADPNSRENSLALWDAEVIFGELSASRNDGAPLWLLTALEEVPM